MIKEQVTRDKATIQRLYKSMVGSQLGYCIQVWIPETEHGKTGESAKKRHKNDSGYKDLSYEERLKRCGLTTLEKWRSRGDSIETYNIVTGNESIQWERFFELAPSNVTQEQII